MSRFPEVCTSKKHFEQNLQRRGEERVLDVMGSNHFSTESSAPLGRVGHGDSPAQDSVATTWPFPAEEVCKGSFGPISALSCILAEGDAMLLQWGWLRLYNKANTKCHEEQV